MEPFWQTVCQIGRFAIGKWFAKMSFYSILFSFRTYDPGFDDGTTDFWQTITQSRVDSFFV